MLLVFFLTFHVIGAFLQNLLAMGIDALSNVTDRALTAAGVNEVLHGLIIDGIFAGVGSVLSFLPLIVVLFFFLSILEDTGYMARVAFVMDQLLRKIGLSGRSIVPMLIGFGCSVPAIMSTRTLASERDRRMTILLTPFMSCSAKIPIYGVFSAAFFPNHAALVMIGLYILGILVGIVAAKVLGTTVYKGNPVPFVMELPNYRFPSAKSVGQLCWDKAKDFLTRAFTIIFVATIIVWFLQTFDTRLNLVDDSADSLLATVGAWIAPLFAPLGFADWRVSTALITGFIAKESVISTLGILTGSGADVSTAALGTLFTPVTAAGFLAFTLLYTPCVAAISAVKRELGSGWKAAGVALSQCVIAWMVAFLVYHIAALLLGARDAFACDIDEKCVDVAYENAALNGIGKDRYTVRWGDVVTDQALRQELGGPYDVVVANIVADVIKALASTVRPLVKEGGIFLCSGIIDDRAEEVAQCLRDNGWTIAETRSSEGWFSYLCR